MTNCRENGYSCRKISLTKQIFIDLEYFKHKHRNDLPYNEVMTNDFETIQEDTDKNVTTTKRSLKVIARVDTVGNNRSHTHIKRCNFVEEL